MPFIKKEVLKKKVEAATAPEHPLLREVSLDVATKTAYVQGCALATLLDDEKTSASEHDMVRSIGLSLGLTDFEIEECFSSVGELSNDDEKGQFIEEITSLLKKDVVNRFFMEDFERTVTINGKASDEVCEIVDYIGALIYNATDWRKKKDDDDRRRELEQQKIKAEAKRKADAADAEKKRREKEKREADKREHIKELSKAFYTKVAKYMFQYQNEYPLPPNAWNKLKNDLSQESLHLVSVEDAICSIEKAYADADRELHEIQGSYSSKTLSEGRRRYAKDLSLTACALCALHKNLTDEDKSTLNGLLRKARTKDGSGWFGVMSRIKNCILKVLAFTNKDGMDGIREIFCDPIFDNILDVDEFVKNLPK
jgi:hypothetical protein